MSFLEEKFKKINVVLECFQEEFDELDKTRLVIQKKLNNLISRFAKDYELTDKNSVRELNFFKVVSRIKEEISLKEKFVRNNLFENFESSFRGNETDRLEIKKTITGIDDLIGIKILTDLDIDCKNMYRLLSSSDFIKAAKDEHIEFDSEDIKNQPQTMKNGLSIYKIKSNYKEYKFELQIKSKLMSSWGDMEHSIFYKDYQLTPVRDTAQQSMNHIGKLLIQIDDFLKSIRVANANFKNNAKALLFINEIEDKYSTKIFTALNDVSFNFQNIAPILFNIKSYCQNEINTENDNLRIQHFDLKPEKYNSYIESRNKDFNLKMLEAIVLDWIINDEINEANIEKTLEKYFELIFTCQSRVIQDLGILEDGDFIKSQVEHLYKLGFDYDCKNFFIQSNKISDIVEKCKIISDIVESDLPSEEITLFNSIFMIFSFDGNLVKFIDSKNEDYEREEIIQILDRIKNAISTTKFNELSTTLTDIINKLA